MKKALLGAGFLVAGLWTEASAIDFGKRFAIGGGVGNVYPMKPDLFKDSFDEAQAWSANMKMGLGVNALSLVASYTYIRLLDEVAQDELTLQPAVLSLRIHPFHKWRLSPYLVLGGGVSFNRLQDSVLPLTTPALTWTKFAGHGGAGLELFLNGGASIGVEGLYHHMTSLPDDSPLRLATVMGTVNIYFGAETSAREAKAENARLKEKLAALEAEALMYKEKAAQEQLQKEQAQKEKLTAQNLANEQQARIDLAQADLNRLKSMMARKDINPVKFMSGKTELDPSSFQTLDMVAGVITKYPDLGLRVEGHTDSMGADAANLRLSQGRADAVRKYLIFKGVNEGQMQSAGFGEVRPITTNATEEGRARNRRVEFFFFVP